MDICRLCLGIKKDVRSIFEVSNHYSYAYKVTSLTNVKIIKGDGITEKICLGCRKKINEVFDFKLMIEMSDATLQSSAKCKTIIFNNLEDIKIKIEITDQDEIIPKYENKIEQYLNNGAPSFVYNGTTIKKLDPCDTAIKSENEPLSVIDFLNNIKEESDVDYTHNFNEDDNYKPIKSDDDYDEEYLLPLAARKRKAQKMSKKKLTKAKSTSKKAPAESKDHKYHDYKSKLTKISIPIKPVFLNDIRVLPTKPAKKPMIGPKKQYKQYIKKEMCNFCGKITGSLKHHLLTHTGERSFKCEVCGKGFLSESTLRKHSKGHTEPNEKTMKCEYCVACFSNVKALRSHMIMHSDEKKYVCDICNKGFKRKGAMRRHNMMHNVTNKNVKCDLCNMTFFSKYGLNHHMRVHTGERPYNCEICSQPYSYKHDFNRHCLKKHGVFLKRRSVNVMNEEVLKRERALMRDLMLKVHGFVNNGENINPFDGPQGAQAFEMAVKAVKAKQIPIDFNL